ncbi:MAG: OmpA family protein [Pseudomonadota bacterium]
MEKKKKNADAPVGGDQNLTMTISLFIIILTFFILLNALAVPDERRRRVAIGSLNGSFGILTGGSSILEGGANQLTPSSVAKGSRLMDLNELLKEKDEIKRDVIVTGNKRRSTLSIPEHRLFNPGEAVLLPESHALLDKIGQIIDKNKYPVDIMGYVDNSDGESAGRMRPRELSTLRAMALLAFFIEKSKVAPNLLSACGWGQFRPTASEQTRETRLLNRRVEVVFNHHARHEEPEGAFTFQDFFFNVFEKKKR